MQAVTNIGRVSIVPQGEYDPAATYNRLDVVQYDGSSYIVLKNGVSGVTPSDGEDYMLAAQKGDVGGTGPVGPQGPKGEPGNDGADGITVAASGVYAFEVDDNGHLLLVYAEDDETPDFSINSDGHLIVNF